MLIRGTKPLLGAVAAICTLLNSSALALPGILDSAVNPANNHVYYLLDNSNWTDAQSAAIGIGGNLATVNDLAENNWIWNLWGTNRNLWIGLNDPINNDGTGAQHAADFVWVSGDTSSYRNWRPGEPNSGNGIPGQAPENWTYILAKGLVPEGGAWNDYLNSATLSGQPPLYGVVEVVPEPATSLLLLGGMFAAVCSKRMRSRR